MPEIQQTPLGDLCDPARGITYGIVKVGDFVPNGVPVIRGGDIRDNHIVFNNEKRVSQEVSEQFRRTILTGGELVMNLISEPGHCALAPDSMSGYNVSRDVAVIALGDSVNHSYINWYLKSPAAVEWVTARLSGSVTLKINLGILRQLPIPVISMADQDAIADLLDALHERITVNARIAETAEKLCIAYFSDESGSAAIPVAELCHLEKKQTNPRVLGNASVLHFSLPSFDAGRVPEVTDPNEIKSSKFMVPPAAVLVSKLNPGTPRVWHVRHDGDVPALASTEFLVLVPVEGVSTAELWAALSQPAFMATIAAKVTGTSKSHQRVNPSEIMGATIADPRIFGQRRQLADALLLRVLAARQETRTLRELRDALLPELMSGRLRVRDVERVVAEAV